MDTMAPTDTIVPIASTLSPESLLEWVRARYNAEGALECKLLTRNYNDTYSVTFEGSRKWIVKVYRHGPGRGGDGLDFEVDLLRHVIGHGVAVAEPISRRDGQFASSVLAPEGERGVVVYDFVEGRELRVAEVEVAESYGATVARFHNASDEFSSASDRHPHDLAYLLERPLETLRRFASERPDVAPRIEEAGSRLGALVRALPLGEMDRGACHGDLHGGNAILGEGGAVLFDFELCGVGWRAYDLGTYHHSARVQKREDAWRRFIAGYRSERRLSAADLAAVPAFAILRHLRLVALQIQRLPALGHANVSDRYFSNWLAHFERVVSAPDAFEAPPTKLSLRYWTDRLRS